ncbi:MAG: phosphatidylglycerol lysyltransferase domain-containing protein, partial [Paracoccaceae bacterium]
PGGMGPFEVVLLSLLPTLPVEALAAAILAYRLVYFAAPAVAAGFLILIAPTVAADRPADRQPLARPQGPVPPSAPFRAESLLFRQGTFDLMADRRGRAAWLTARTGNCAVALFDPMAGPSATSQLLPNFSRQCREEEAFACLYKIGRRTAVMARQAGWHLLPISEECWLAPASFTTDIPARSGLRRKLRKAREADITITAHRPFNADGTVPWGDLQRIDRQWCEIHGGNKGFSMGRFAPDYLAAQQLFIAWVSGRPVAFVSFHATQMEWTLDLVRQGDAALDGTMQSLIAHAVEVARGAQVPRLSLAAVTLPSFGLGGLAGRVAEHLARRQGTAGLRQFKASFAPRRSRLYLAAPTRLALTLGAFEIWRAIHNPPPLPPSSTKPLPAWGDGKRTYESHSYPT